MKFLLAMKAKARVRLALLIKLVAIEFPYLRLEMLEFEIALYRYIDERHPFLPLANKRYCQQLIIYSDLTG